MINTAYNNFSIANTRPQTACGKPGGCTDTTPSDSFSMEVPASFEPWLGGAPSLEPALPPSHTPVGGGMPELEPGPCPSFEAWNVGEPTTNPSIGGAYANKAFSTFGEQALLSLDDQRITGCAGYFFDGLETPGGGDWLTGVTLGRLGDKWECTSFGEYEIRSGSTMQHLRFDTSSGATFLTTSYEDNTYDTSTRRETLVRDSNGNMSRQVDAAGL